MFQADDLQPGDIVVFKGVGGIDEDLAEIMGLIVSIEDPVKEGPAALIQFYAGDDFYAGPLHYYHQELNNFIKCGELRIIRGN